MSTVMSVFRLPGFTFQTRVSQNFMTRKPNKGALSPFFQNLSYRILHSFALVKFNYNFSGNKMPSAKKTGKATRGFGTKDQ